jgi:hypothetical protein
MYCVILGSTRHPFAKAGKKASHVAGADELTE